MRKLLTRQEADVLSRVFKLSRIKVENFTQGDIDVIREFIISNVATVKDVVLNEQASTLKIPLSDIDFEKKLGANPALKLRNILKANGINTVLDLVQKSRGDIIRMQFVGSKSVKAIEELLCERNLKLGMKLE